MTGADLLPVCERDGCCNRVKQRGRRFCSYSCSNTVTTAEQWRRNPRSGNSKKGSVVAVLPRPPRTAADVFLLGGCAS